MLAALDRPGKLGFAHVRYRSVEEAETVLAQARRDPPIIAGQRFDLTFSDDKLWQGAPRPPQASTVGSEPNKILYMGNLDFKVTAAEIGQTMERFGEGLVEVRLGK